MRIAAWTLCVIMLTLGGVASRSADLIVQRTTTVPAVKSQKNKPLFINVILNESYTATMLVDTGADATLIRRSVLEKLDVPLVTPMGRDGRPLTLPFDDGSPAQGAHIDYVEIGSLPLLPEVPMFATSDARLAELFGPHIDGILGMNVLFRFAVVINWSESTLTFSYPGKLSERDLLKYGCSADDSVDMPMSVTNQFTVPLRLGPTHVENLRLDTGGEHTRLTKPVLQESGAVFESSEVELRTLSGKIMWRTAVLPDARLGRMIAKPFRVVYAPVEARGPGPAIGVDLLSQSEITILDFPGRRLYLKPRNMQTPAPGSN